MLAVLRDILGPAREQKVCIAQFNVLTRGMARGVIDAAEEARVPIVLGIEEEQLEVCSLKDFADSIRPLAMNARVPIAIHLDHCSSYEKCVDAMKLGFTSVNYDCSTLPLSENIASVKKLVRVARAMDVTVEAELGHTPKSGEEALFAYTDPDEAAAYVQETQVDALAIAIGTSHGEYLTEPKLDFDRIKKIAKVTKLPLVLHGGSGLSDRTVKKAIASGITKIDLFTDLNIACFQGDIQAYNDGIRLKSEAIPYEIHAVKTYADEKLALYSGRM